MPYKQVKQWIPGCYKIVRGKRKLVRRGYYRTIRKWVAPKYKISRSYKR